MAEHVTTVVAYLRDDLVLEALMIAEPSTTGRILLDAKTSQEADQLFRLAGCAA